MITVLLADDHPLIRKGFRLILDAEPDIEVAGEAGDGATAVSLCAELRPDVVLMDVRMPGRDGIAATRDILAAGLPSKVLILTTFDLDDYVYAGLRAGASGFLLKDTQPEGLVAAIHTIAAGDAVLAPAATRRLIRQFTTQPAEPPDSRRAAQIQHALTEPRAGRLRPDRGRHVQQRDRGPPAPVRGHREDPCRPDTRQARPAGSRPSRRARLRIDSDRPRDTPAEQAGGPALKAAELRGPACRSPSWASTHIPASKS